MLQGTLIRPHKSLYIIVAVCLLPLTLCSNGCIAIDLNMWILHEDLCLLNIDFARSLCDRSETVPCKTEL